MANVADYNVANASGASVRSDINNILQAVVTLNSGTSEPSTMYPFMIWVDTNSNVVKMRNGANDAWLTMPFAMNASNTAPGGLTVSGSNLTLDGVDIAKSGSADLTLDSGGRIDLSADDNGEVRLFDGASNYGQFKDDEDRLTIQGLKEDKDMLFVVNDGSVATTAMKIIAADAGDVRFYGRVGIGGTPSSYNSNTNNFVIRDSGNGGMTISTGASSTGYVAFNDGEDTTIEGLIAYNQSNDVMSFRTAGTDDRLVIDGSGNIGMGTASPSTNLHIYSTANNAPHLLLENFQNADTDDAAVIELYLNDQTTGGIGDDTDVGVIRFTGDEKDGGTKETYAEIRGVAHDPGQGASNKGNLSFFIQAAGALNETFILDEKVVGINDSAPSYTLDVNTSGNSSGFRVTNGTNGQDINCLISNGGTTAGDDSLLDLSVAAGAGDPKIRFSISGTENFEMGIDNTDSDLFKISNGTALGTSDLLTLNSGGSMFLGATAAVDGEFVNISKNGTTKVLISCLENSSARDAILSFQTRNGGSQCRINFADGSGAGTGSGQIFYNHDGNTLTFITDSTENMVLDSSGNLTIQGSYSPSDGRLKENIEDFTYDIEKFKAYSPKTFDWINPEEHGGKTQQIGFIAQEQEAIDPRFVEEVETDADRKDTKLLDTITKLDGDVKGISKTSEFVQKDAMYISIIQQLITRLETAEQKIAALEGGN
jgi:hypothetical protein